MLITSEYKHLTKEEFLDKLRTRFVSHYPKVLFPNGTSPGMLLAVINSGHSLIKNISERFDNLITTNNLFWGYGINAVSVDKDKISNWDIHEIPYAEPLNRHHNPDCHTFSLIIFTVVNSILRYNLFHMDVVRNKLNSNEGTLDLNKHVMTIVRTRRNDGQMPEKVFIESVFVDAENSLSFQIDSLFSESYALCTAEYYKKEINKTAVELKMATKDKSNEQIHVSGSGNNVIVGHNNSLINQSNDVALPVKTTGSDASKTNSMWSFAKHPVWSAVIATAITSLILFFIRGSDIVKYISKLLNLFK